jgi:hypothetical protein
MTESSSGSEAKMLRVVIESPLNALTREGIEENKSYAKRCVIDCLRRGESPYASHLFFDQPGILDDLKADDRKRGIQAGLMWGSQAHKVVVYMDRGISKGMQLGIDFYRHQGIPIEERWLDKKV